MLVPSPHRYDPAESGVNVVSWSPYARLELGHRVQATYLRGQLVFDGKTVLSRPGSGRFVRPEFAAVA